MKKIMLVVIALLSLAACASSGRIGTLPSIPAGAPSSELVVIRPGSFFGGAASYYLQLDSNDIFAIRSGEYTRFNIPAGEHLIGVKCFGGFSPSWKEEAKALTAVPGMKYYYVVTPSAKCADIKQVDEKTASKEISAASFISPQTESK